MFKINIIPFSKSFRSGKKSRFIDKKNTITSDDRGHGPTLFTRMLCKGDKEQAFFY